MDMIRGNAGDTKKEQRDAVPILNMMGCTNMTLATGMPIIKLMLTQNQHQLMGMQYSRLQTGIS